MITRFRTVLSLALILFATGCWVEPDNSSPPIPFLTEQFINIPTATLTDVPTPPTAPTATQGVTFPTLEATEVIPAFPYSEIHPSYEITATLDYSIHRLYVTERITYPTNENTPQELLLVVDPSRHTGVFELGHISDHRGRELTEFALDSGYLYIPTESIAVDDRLLSFRIDYTLNLPSQPSKNGYTKNQTNLGDWYPFIPPYHDHYGWLAYEPSTVGEHLVYDAADFDIFLRIVNAPKDIVVAASAQPESVDGTEYNFKLHFARSFSISISPFYQTLSASVGNIVVNSYFFKQDEQAGEAVLQASTAALELFQKEFSPYPFKSLSIVEAEFLDGMEYHGLYFLGQEYYREYAGSPRSYLVSLAAHETAHQWWYGTVGNDQAMEPWLDESLCTYSELIFYERYFPDLRDWWWQYRALRFRPDGWVNANIYQYGNFRSYVDAVYLRGAIMLDQVRITMGEEAFFESLRNYLAENTNKIATRQSFFESFKLDTADNLRSITQMYFLPSE